MGRRRLALTLAVATAVPFLSVGVVSSTVSARAAKVPHYVGDAPGSITCTLSATVAFSPRLTDTGGATNPSSTNGVLTGCTTTDAVVKVAGGRLSGSFAPSTPPTCTDLASLTTPATFSIRWNGDVSGAIGTTTYKGKATFATTAVSSASERISSFGNGDLELVAPTNAHGASTTGSFSGGAQASVFTNVSANSLDTLCHSKASGGTGKGIRKLTLNGTITIGASVGTQLINAELVATDAQQSFCAVLTTGAIRCWGDNDAGQLGDGTTATSSVAMAVSGVTKADGIASDGDDSFCAVLTTGAVNCWGSNSLGELGNGTTTGSSVPVVATGITNALAVTSDGDGSYCAVLQSGSINCWGSNSSGQLGDGTTAQSSVPVAVTGITNDATVTSDGNGSFCAVLTTAVVECWGANNFGQLGDNATAGSATPMAVVGITDAATVSSDGDDSFCTLLTTGAAECWGANFAGELGNGTTVKSTVPVAVTGLTTASSISADGAEAYCAVLTSGAADCWGSNIFGELGDGTTTNSSVPVAVTGISDAASVSGDGDESFCAVLTSGAIDCWGANLSGELGDGTTTSSSVPTAVTGIATAVTVAGGIHPPGATEHAYCTVLSSGAVDCWGSNSDGELGDATTTNSTVPVTVIEP